MNSRTRFESIAAVALSLATLGGIIAADAASAAQPYGGCDEAWQAPQSDGAEQCRADGWTVRPRLVVNPHGVVRYSALPSCAVEDGSSGPVPCSWNFGDTDGNGRGLAFYATGDAPSPRLRYVWATQPTGDGWQWVGERLAEKLEGRRDWTRCVVNYGDTTRVRCADGRRVSS